MQLTIYDSITLDDALNHKIAKLLNLEDKILVNTIARSVINFQLLPKQLKYCLSFSGGKDSHVLLGIYNLYLQLGNSPLDLVVKFADTQLEQKSLYQIIEQSKFYCDRLSIPFEIVKGKQSYWYVQFALGYPVPDFRIRWCTGKLKVQPMHPSRKIKPITGRHYGESTARDSRLNKSNSCGSSDTCGTDAIKQSYDPLIHWRNCQIWDAIFYFEGKLLYPDCFNLLKNTYNSFQDDKSGSLRMGCFMCPVISLKTIEANLKSNLINSEEIAVRYLLEELRNARRIKNPRTQKNGAIHVEDRRKYWQQLNHEFLIERGYLSPSDRDVISDLLKSDYSYPPTYKKEWIDLQHKITNNAKKTAT